MKQLWRGKYFVFILIVAIVMIGCPGNVKKQSNQDVYYQALGFWLDTYDNFRLIYDDPALTEAQKMEMLPTMEILLNTKKFVLNPWKATLATGDKEAQYSKMAEWKGAKNKLILEVVNKYFPKEGG